MLVKHPRRVNKNFGAFSAAHAACVWKYGHYSATRTKNTPTKKNAMARPERTSCIIFISKKLEGKAGNSGKPERFFARRQVRDYPIIRLCQAKNASSLLQTSRFPSSFFDALFNDFNVLSLFPSRFLYFIDL